GADPPVGRGPLPRNRRSRRRPSPALPHQPRQTVAPSRNRTGPRRVVDAAGGGALSSRLSRLEEERSPMSSAAVRRAALLLSLAFAPWLASSTPALEECRLLRQP